MRELPLKSRLASNGAEFENRFGVEMPIRFQDKATEYKLIRDAVGVTDFSFMQKFRVPEETAIDFLDGLLAGNVAKTRFGRILHTFIADDAGKLVADCYVANNDEEFIVLCESILPDNEIRDLFMNFGGTDAGLEDLTDNHVVINLDGYQAWKVAQDLFGADVMGLPYLSLEVYKYEGVDVRLMRAGKTSEFGYSLLIPVENADFLFDKVLEKARKVDGSLCGFDIHNDLRLEGRFFNLYAEGLKVGDPLTLGLQWMIDFDKEEYRGRQAIMDRRAQGPHKKIIGVRAAADEAAFIPGASLYAGKDAVANVVAVTYSYTLDAGIGLALFPFDIAYAGLEFTIGGPDGSAAKTISMPPIIPKSLTVRLDEL
jgi:glycine cleavage system aminomethyltransferase T